MYTGFLSEPHSCEKDAIASIKLFNKYHEKPALIEEAKKKLKETRSPPSFGKRNNYRWEGVCMAGFVPKRCFCGAPTLREL